MIRLFNTLSGKVEPFEPITPGVVKLYTCGPTVYDYQHIGNYRAYVFEDLLKRFLRFSGFKVIHVMNITDVDDKTIRGANARGISLEEYTRPFIAAFMNDLQTLNTLPADRYPRATEHVREMVGIIRILLEKGFAYKKDGSVYFAIDKFPSYGRLSKINLEDLRPGSRGDADEYEKESVHDFALWKAPKEGEPVWETEIGPGRPGWHIECSAMSSKYLGRTFDIHCGGVDNIFPHHENEIAQSEAANGVKFVNYWLHCHHLVVDGEKMAKSKGNFYTLGDVLAKDGDRYDALDVRYLLISTHYRKMLNFMFETLDQAKAARERLGSFLADLRDVPDVRDGGEDAGPIIERARLGFIAGLEDDLNISESLASLFSLVKTVNPLLAQGRIARSQADAVLRFFTEVEGVLGIKPPSTRLASGTITGLTSAAGQATVLEAELQARINERQKARAAKDFKRADQIRDELLRDGILLEDTKDGVRWKKIGPPKP